MNHMIRFITAITLVLELIFCIGGFSDFCDEVPDKDNIRKGLFWLMI